MSFETLQVVRTVDREKFFRNLGLKYKITAKIEPSCGYYDSRSPNYKRAIKIEYLEVLGVDAKKLDESLHTYEEGQRKALGKEMDSLKLKSESPWENIKRLSDADEVQEMTRPLPEQGQLLREIELALNTLIRYKVGSVCGIPLDIDLNRLKKVRDLIRGHPAFLGD